MDRKICEKALGKIPGAFIFAENYGMEKTKKNKKKDKARHGGLVWVDKRTKPNERTTGSGVTFTGKYVDPLKR